MPKTEGKYWIFTDSKGKYRFHLKSANGKIVVPSQGYTTLYGCERGIKAVKRLAGSPVCKKLIGRNNGK